MGGQSRGVLEHFSAQAAIEGAGVHLHRGFGRPHIPKFDPFLLFDDFSSDNPADYLPGFPMHPHRGIETVTYIIDGEVRHKDSIGNGGSIGKGEVQWMTAGSGIMHEEMPQEAKPLKGFQLWVNLPSDSKMTDPRYRGIRSAEIPEIPFGRHAKARAIAGSFNGVDAALSDILADPLYLDISVRASDEIDIPIPHDYNAFLYVFDNSIQIDKKKYKEGTVILLDQKGGKISLATGSSGARFLLAAGKPLGEPIAWYGPIVMNSQDELVTAVEDLQSGNFVQA